MTEGDELVHDGRRGDADALTGTVEEDAVLRSTVTAVAVLDRARPEPERHGAARRDAWDDEVPAVGAPRRSPGRTRRAAPRR